MDNILANVYLLSVLQIGGLLLFGKGLYFLFYYGGTYLRTSSFPVDVNEFKIEHLRSQYELRMKDLQASNEALRKENRALHGELRETLKEVVQRIT